MATLKPFQPYRYTAKAGDPANLLTQPYDKINPAMQTKYLAASPYNLVRVILGERLESDTPGDNVYTRSAKYLNDWIREGILSQDPQPAFYAYFQDFEVPDTKERATRIGFIGLGKVEDYSANVVFRHEQTLSGPKKDRREVLNHTGAHFGQIFMLYRDQDFPIDKLLEQAAQEAPVLDVLDDYQARHRLWPITDAATIAQIQELMEDKKLLIADGHHRYETALAYRTDHPDDPAAQYVMMTFVNMFSPGLKILATHRVMRDIPGFSIAALLDKATESGWSVTESGPSKTGFVRIGVVTSDGGLDSRSCVLERPRKEGELDVPVLHKEIIGELLGISEEAVREEKHITYVRGTEAAVAEVRNKGAQVAFLLEPTPIEDMARIAFGGGVMPQKSTDFYPKLLSGVTIYKLY